jgi:hypothetical protein
MSLSLTRAKERGGRPREHVPYGAVPGRSALTLGLTIREHLAGLALQGLLSRPLEGAMAAKADIYARAAVRAADALLVALQDEVTP